MLGIPGKLLDEEGSWLIIVQDTNHCLSVINQPDSMFNIVFYHINIMVMNVYIRIFFFGGGWNAWVKIILQLEIHRVQYQRNYLP